MKNKLLYTLAILLPVLLLVLPVILLLVFISNGNIVFLFAAGVCLVLALVTSRPLSNLRQQMRDAVQSDEFGVSTRKRYTSLSQKERDAIDLQKTADMERIVSTATLKKMTHPGSTDPTKELELLVGLGDVKQRVEEMAARMEFEKQERKLKGRKYVSQFDSGQHAVYFGPPGTGKAQPLYSSVLTPDGFKTMGSIQVGDKVISATNHVTTVLGVYPQGKKPIYEITLDNGAKCRCSDEHLWFVTINDKADIVTLKNMLTINDIISIPTAEFAHTPEMTDTLIMRDIVSIRYIGEEECQCIYIDDESHLYITDDYIVTHNTTIARIMTGFLYKYGYIKENKCMEVDGNFLKAGAETATKTTMVIRHALGGVLFVDEAYALVQGDAYGQDAIATLIKQMEDLRGRFVLIIAGYTDEMRDLLNANPGFQSRLKEYLYFESYNDEDMLTIFKTMAKSRGYEISSQAIEPFTQRVQAERALPSFGNARTARSILDEAIEKHAYRCIKQQLPQDQRYLIDAPDINPKPNAI
jgi:hypothetical protein